LLTSFDLQLGRRPPTGFEGDFLGIMGGQVDYLRLVGARLLWEFFGEEVIVPIGEITQHYYNIEDLTLLLFYSQTSFL
jgi:hypothetical protein